MNFSPEIGLHFAFVTASDVFFLRIEQWQLYQFRNLSFAPQTSWRLPLTDVWAR